MTTAAEMNRRLDELIKLNDRLTALLATHPLDTEFGGKRIVPVREFTDTATLVREDGAIGFTHAITRNWVFLKVVDGVDVLEVPKRDEKHFRGFFGLPSEGTA